jgi:hypothetical protein
VRRVRRRQPVPAGRQAPHPLQDGRLRADVDEDRRRHPRAGVHARDPRRPGAPRAALRRHRARRVGVVRRRRALAVAEAEPPPGPGPRPRGQGGGPGRRHARPLVLGHGRRLGAAAGRPDDRRQEPPLQAARRLPHGLGGRLLRRAPRGTTTSPAPTSSWSSSSSTRRGR